MGMHVRSLSVYVFYGYHNKNEDFRRGGEGGGKDGEMETETNARPRWGPRWVMEVEIEMEGKKTRL